MVQFYAAAAAKLLQSCPTLCNPIDGSPSGSPVPGILQARTLEWDVISFSSVLSIYLYIYIYILFHILFYYGLLQDIEYSFLRYTVEFCCLSILYIVVYIC